MYEIDNRKIFELIAKTDREYRENMKMHNYACDYVIHILKI